MTEKKLLFLSKEKKIYSNEEKSGDSQKKEIETHCKEALKSENLVILTGAGSSKNGGGKLISEIWSEIFENSSNPKKIDLNQVLKLISSDKEEGFCKNTNLEELLSRLEIERKAQENKKGNSAEILKEIKTINSEIKRCCSDKNTDPKTHKDFLTKILAARKKTSPRAKIFTLNYDTFFEDAASDIKAVVIDGFCFNEERTFNSTDFDLDIVQRENSRIHKEENFYDKVLHLYKMHGSVSWKLEGKEIKKLDKSQIDEPLLIYPNASKFEESYQMPFYEMISRFQISLRANNTTLMIIGYSFGDSHINRIIEEAVDSNLSLKVIMVDLEIAEPEEQKPKNLKESLINYAKNSERIIFFGTEFKKFVEALPEISYETEKEKTLADFIKSIKDNQEKGEKTND